MVFLLWRIKLLELFNKKGEAHTQVAYIYEYGFTIEGKILYYVVVEDIKNKIINNGCYLLEDEINLNDYYVLRWK